MLSLCELHRAARILEQRLTSAVLQRIVQVDDRRLALEFFAAGSTLNVLFNCSPESARLCSIGRMPQAPAAPPALAQYLRAHLGRAACAGIATREADRQATLRLRTRAGDFALILSILGSRSNVYLLDGEGMLLFAMRRLEGTRSELAVGQPWADPPSRLRSEGSDRWADVPDEQYLEAIEQAYRAKELRKEFDDLARRLEQTLTKEQSFLARKSGNLYEDLAEALKAEEYREQGELLKTALHKVRPGATSVCVQDFRTGAEVVIPLDPTLTPAGNLEVYFKRYQKELRGAEAIGQQIDTVGEDQARLALLQEELRTLLEDGPAALTALREFAQRPGVRRLLARHYPQHGARRPAGPVAGKRREVPGRLQPRRFRGEHGWEIWVGRSDEGNDYLTTRLARGSDIFFHLEGYSGSHVILRTEGRKDPPPEAVLDACELAVHFSKLKSARSAEVHMVPVKNVKKPRGAKPGMVHVVKGKTIRLRRDAKRLENILASRLDE